MWVYCLHISFKNKICFVASCTICQTHVVLVGACSKHKHTPTYLMLTHLTGQQGVGYVYICDLWL